MSQTNLKSNPNSSLLKETRLAKGLTLEIVHEATKIPMDALRAIEDGYSTRILTPFYYRGFIKIYGEFLGLNVSDVLKEYNVQTTVTNVTIKSSSAAKVVSPPKGPSVFDQLPDIWRSFWTAKMRKNLLRVIAVVVALFVLVKIVGCVAGAIKSKPKTVKTIVVTNQANKKHVIKKEQFKSELKEESKQESAIQPQKQNIPQEDSNKISLINQNHKVTLAVHASKDTWIQVKADGKTVFEMTMKKGTMENWEADREIELSGRNIGNLDFEVNGRDVSPLSSFNRRANKILITKDGLTVKK